MKFLRSEPHSPASLYPAPAAQDKAGSADKSVRQLERAWNQAEMKQEVAPWTISLLIRSLHRLRRHVHEQERSI